MDFIKVYIVQRTTCRSESYVHRRGKEIFDMLMENIKGKAGENSECSSQLFMDIGNRLEKQLPASDKK
jgi:hypothetical protein